MTRAACSKSEMLGKEHVVKITYTHGRRRYRSLGSSDNLGSVDGNSGQKLELSVHFKQLELLQDEELRNADELLLFRRTISNWQSTRGSVETRTDRTVKSLRSSERWSTLA